MLYNAIRPILEKAIKNKGTTFRNYLSSDGKVGNHTKYLQVYGRVNQSCLVCKQVKIKKTKVAGRGIHFCDKCQI